MIEQQNLFGQSKYELMPSEQINTRRAKIIIQAEILSEVEINQEQVVEFIDKLSGKQKDNFIDVKKIKIEYAKV